MVQASWRLNGYQMTFDLSSTKLPQADPCFPAATRHLAQDLIYDEAVYMASNQGGSLE